MRSKSNLLVRGAVRVPEPMWVAMKTALNVLVGANPNEQRLFREEGTFVEIRLASGLVKTVLVRADGCITNEWYEEWGIRAEKYGPPRFATDELESWGYFELVRQPSWRQPFRKEKVWRVRVWADGRLGQKE